MIYILSIFNNTLDCIIIVIITLMLFGSQATNGFQLSDELNDCST